MKSKKILAGILSSVMLINICGTTLISYAADTNVVQETITEESTNTVQETSEKEPFELSEVVEKVNSLIESKEDGFFSNIMDILYENDGYYYEILAGLSSDARTQLLEKLSKEEAYQFELHSKYAFVKEMIEYKDKEELKESDMEVLGSYVEIYAAIVEKQSNEVIDAEQIKVLDQEVYESIVSRLDPGASENVKDFTSYAEYLQTLTDLDVMKVLEAFESFVYTNPDDFIKITKEFKNFVYATYGFDELIEDQEENKEEEKNESVQKDEVDQNATDVESDEIVSDEASDLTPKATPTVYVDGSYGNDSNNGSSASSPVKTLARAYTLLKTTGGNISIINPVYTSGETYIKGNFYSGSDGRNISLNSGCTVQIVRYIGNKNKLIQHSGNSLLTVGNITFHGSNYTENSTAGFISITNGASINAYGVNFLNLSGSSASGWSGCVEIRGGKGTFSDCTFRNNYSQGGSAIHADNGASITIDKCIFDGNKGNKTPEGGTVFVGDATATITNSEFKNNSNKFGAAIVVWGSKPVTVKGTKFTNNTTTDHSGAIAVPGTAHLTIDNCTFTNNKSTRLAGAIYSVSTVDIKNNTVFEGNSSGQGGAVYTAGTSTISSTSFQNNSAQESGGGIYTSGKAIITNSLFSNNQANLNGGNNSGGALALAAGGELVNTEITSNSAAYGAGIYVGENKALSLNNVSFSKNTATVNGGAIYVPIGTGTTVLKDSSITGNTALNGSGIYQGGILKMNGSTLLTEDNDVYLPEQKFITINGPLTTQSEKIARVTPETYSLGRKLVEVSYNNKVASDYLERFTLTPKDEFTIRPGDYISD